VRKVALGPVDGANIAIDSGLTPGDLVVVDGADRLREGAKVELPGKESAPSKSGGPLKGKGGKGKRQGGDGSAPRPGYIAWSAAYEPLAPLHSAAGCHVAVHGGPSCLRVSSRIACCLFPRFPRSITRRYRS